MNKSYLRVNKNSDPDKHAKYEWKNMTLHGIPFVLFGLSVF